MAGKKNLSDPEAVERLLEEDLVYLVPLARLCVKGAITVPLEDIPRLDKAFQDTREKVLDLLKDVFVVLDRQAQEIRAKEFCNDNVLAYLVNHPNGSKLVELEEYFEVERIQVARVVRELMDDNKAEKRDILYFAI